MYSARDCEPYGPSLESCVMCPCGRPGHTVLCSLFISSQFFSMRLVPHSCFSISNSMTFYSLCQCCLLSSCTFKCHTDNIVQPDHRDVTMIRLHDVVCVSHHQSAWSNHCPSSLVNVVLPMRFLQAVPDNAHLPAIGFTYTIYVCFCAVLFLFLCFASFCSLSLICHQALFYCMHLMSVTSRPSTQPRMT
jgi:hypothetical protein